MLYSRYHCFLKKELKLFFFLFFFSLDVLLQEEAAKILLAEFNLGCDVQHTEHVYRVYVTTFLGFGGNFARQRYEDLVLNETLNKNRYI